jgi:hypothetical protein
VNPAASLKKTFKDKEELSLGSIGEDHGTCVELGAARKNLSEYGERYVEKVTNGTGEILLYTFLWNVKRKPISVCEMVDGRKGVGGGHSIDEMKTTQLHGEKDPYFVHKLEGGKSE